MRCPHMALNTLEKLEACLRDGTPEVVLDLEVADKARRSIEAMLKLG